MLTFKAKRTLTDLEAYLTLNGGELAKWLAREVKSWGEFSYSDLEAAIEDGRLNELIDWQERYSQVVNEFMAPAWLKAIETASKKVTRGKIILSDSEDDVRTWLSSHGAQLVTQLSDESRKAIANVLLKWTTELLDPKRMAQQIRPLIGLNERQAIANANYRDKLYQRLLENGVPPSKAAIRADKAAIRYASKQHRDRAETIVNTELAFAYNRGAHMGVTQSIARGYMKRCAMVWSTAGTNRVCGRCLELGGTIVGYTDEVGVQLPPLHPRCRCAIIYREEKTQSKPQEHAIVYDNGLRNSYTVNFNLTNTKAYHDRFESLTTRKTVNEALYKQAVGLLGRRSGSQYEELIIVDARTGKLLAQNTEAVGNRAFQCGLSQEQAQRLAQAGKAFEALHNHPNSSYPSLSDVTTLFTRELQSGSTVACHNGTVYHLTKLKDFAPIKEIAELIRKEIREAFANYPSHLVERHAAQALIGKLEKLGVLKFKEVS